jgi:Integrase zinc binding domain/Integrase core domain
VSEGLHKVYVPHAHSPSGKSLRTELISEFHDSPIAGHFGPVKCVAALSQHYYWPTLEADVVHYTSSCAICQRIKPTKQPTPHAHPLHVPSKPFEHITLDWVTGFPESRRYNAVLNIVDRFTKWAIVIPCRKSMKCPRLCELLWQKVFSWIGLPAYITGDRDTRLTAQQFRSLCRYLGIELRLSVSYRPQTDGQTERFNRIFLQMLRAYVNEHHTDWPTHIPAVVYAHNNTIHSATGFTPHRLLFGWCPRDIRTPLHYVASENPDVDAILQRCKTDFELAKVSLEEARQRMIKAARGSPNAFVYKPGDLIKVSTRVLEPHASVKQVTKLQPKYLGPFEVLELVGASVRVSLPATFSLVHDVFNVNDIRPWVSVQQDFDSTLPSSSNSAQDRIVSVLDRKQASGRLPNRLDSLLSIPAQYFVVRSSGKAEWLHQREFKARSDRLLLLDFERNYPRSAEKRCVGVKEYPGVEREVLERNVEEPSSPDELYLPDDTMWEFELHQYFHDVY